MADETFGGEAPDKITASHLQARRGQLRSDCGRANVDMSGNVADYNTDRAPTLFAPGRLGGLAIQVDPTSIAPLAGAGGRVYRAGLKGPNAFAHLRGGQFGVVAVKVTEDDRTRQPRNPKREATLLAALDHPNVRIGRLCLCLSTDSVQLQCSVRRNIAP